MEKQKSIQWQSLIEMIIVILIILVSTIPLYVHTNKLEYSIQEIRKEIKDLYKDRK